MSTPDPVALASLRPPHLSPAHWEELTVGSAIHPDVIDERGYRTIRGDDVPIGFAEYQMRDGLLIPLRGDNGTIRSFQLKPDRPRSDNSRAIKYETPTLLPLCIDIPGPSIQYLGDPNTPLWITEGSKKVDAGVSHGIRCIIGLQGVYGWRGKNEKGGKTALPDWEHIALNGRDVILAFDSDCMSKPQVRVALDRLAAFLRLRGAEVGYCLLPHLADGEKCGLDDFFATGGTYNEVCDFLTSTLPPLPEPEDDEPQPDLVRLSDVHPQEIGWLWPGWIPRRMMTILGGYGGDGKSTVVSSLIGAWTGGGRLPDGTPAPETNVLMLAAEDDVAQAIRPRLDLHGADNDRVLVLRGSKAEDGSPRWLDLRRDIAMMEGVVRSHEIGLVVIDPLSAYLPNADRNSEGDVRDTLQPLLGLMERTGVAVVGIMHIGKSGDGRRAAQRLLGSTAFTALARSVIMLADLPDDQQPDDVESGGKQKVLQVVKSNYAIAPPPQAFRRPLNGPIAWLGASGMTIEECFTGASQPRKSAEEGRSAGQEAEHLLRETLKWGSQKATDVMTEAKENGITEITLRRAKRALGIETFKTGKTGPWFWKLPGTVPEAEGDHSPTDTLDDHLLEEREKLPAVARV